MPKPGPLQLFIASLHINSNLSPVRVSHFQNRFPPTFTLDFPDTFPRFTTNALNYLRHMRELKHVLQIAHRNRLHRGYIHKTRLYNLADEDDGRGHDTRSDRSTVETLC